MKQIIIIVSVVFLILGGFTAAKRSQRPPSASPSPTLTSNGCKVGGCNSEVCAKANEVDQIATDCLWEEKYACYRNARCERQTNGVCDWTQDEELTTCLKTQ